MPPAQLEPDASTADHEQRIGPRDGRRRRRRTGKGLLPRLQNRVTDPGRLFIGPELAHARHRAPDPAGVAGFQPGVGVDAEVPYPVAGRFLVGDGGVEPGTDPGNRLLGAAGVGAPVQGDPDDAALIGGSFRFEKRPGFG